MSYEPQGGKKVETRDGLGWSDSDEVMTWALAG